MASVRHCVNSAPYICVWTSLLLFLTSSGAAAVELSGAASALVGCGCSRCVGGSCVAVIRTGVLWLSLQVRLPCRSAELLSSACHNPHGIWLVMCIRSASGNGVVSVLEMVSVYPKRWGDAQHSQAKCEL